MHRYNTQALRTRPYCLYFPHVMSHDSAASRHSPSPRFHQRCTLRATASRAEIVCVSILSSALEQFHSRRDPWLERSEVVETLHRLHRGIARRRVQHRVAVPHLAIDPGGVGPEDVC